MMILLIWRSVVEDCDNENVIPEDCDNENVIHEDFLQGQQWMCRGCFSAYSRYLALKKKRLQIILSVHWKSILNFVPRSQDWIVRLHHQPVQL